MTKPTWKRFRADNGATWANLEEWPAGDARYVLVHNSCDGYHVWYRSDSYTPPGTHWRHMPSPPNYPK